MTALSFSPSLSYRPTEITIMWDGIGGGREGGKLRDRTHNGFVHAKQLEKYVPEFYSKLNTNKVFQLNLSTPLVQLLDLFHGGGVSYGQIEVAQVPVKPGKGPVLVPGAKGVFF